MACFAWARNDKRNLTPLAGRGRRRREAKSPGEGDYPRVRACRDSPSPARKMLATSPRRRGEVKKRSPLASWLFENRKRARHNWRGYCACLIAQDTLTVT